MTAARPPERPGEAEMAGVINEWRKLIRHRLVLLGGADVVEWLSAWHTTSLVPPMATATDGGGVSYSQIEVYMDPALARDAWRLLADGEPVGSGVLGDG